MACWDTKLANILGNDGVGNENAGDVAANPLATAGAGIGGTVNDTVEESPAADGTTTIDGNTTTAVINSKTNPIAINSESTSGGVEAKDDTTPAGVDPPNGTTNVDDIPATTTTTTAVIYSKSTSGGVEAKDDTTDVDVEEDSPAVDGTTTIDGITNTTVITSESTSAAFNSKSTQNAFATKSGATEATGTGSIPSGGVDIVSLVDSKFKEMGTLDPYKLSISINFALQRDFVENEREIITHRINQLEMGE